MRYLTLILLLCACGGGGDTVVLETPRPAVLFKTDEFGWLYWPAYIVYDSDAQPGSQDAYVIDERGVRHDNALEIEGWYAEIESRLTTNTARVVAFEEWFSRIPGPVAVNNADGVFDIGDGRVKPTDVWLAQWEIP